MSSIEKPQYKPSPFLKAIIDEYHKDGAIVGEDSNVGMLFFTAVSSYLPKPYRQHAIVVSQSSAGKSTLVNRVLEPFNERLLNFTRFTGAALDRYKEDFDGKIFLYQQATGNEPFQIKPLLSEGELNLLVLERDRDGQFKPTKHELKGLPVFITTTTDPSLDDELMNRALVLTLDESDAQTNAIMNQISLEASTVHGPSLGKYSQISQIIKVLESSEMTIHEIIIPYAQKLNSFLPNHLEMRRDFSKFLKLIQAIAFVKSVCFRGYHEFSLVSNSKAKIIVANLDDLNDALYLFKGDLADLVYRLPAEGKRILEILRSSITKGLQGDEYEKLTAKQIFSKLGRWNRTTYNYLNDLVARGCVSKEPSGIGNAYLFQAAQEDQSIGIGSIDFDEDDKEAWVRENLSDAQFKTPNPNIGENS